MSPAILPDPMHAGLASSKKISPTLSATNRCGMSWTNRKGIRPRMTVRAILLALLLSGSVLPADVDPLEGLWQGYDGEWLHVSHQLVALAEAMPAEKFAWRPGPGVRSTSEVFMHIATANFGLLSITGPRLPAGLKLQDAEKTVTAKADVIG